MKLYLVQHAAAVDKAIHPKRPLSETGLADAIKMAAYLFEADILVERMVHSGKLRAEETANVLSKTVWLGQTPHVIEGLQPNDSTDRLMALAHETHGDLMAVGHLPFMERMVARCLTGREDGAHFGFEPGTVACLERTDDGWQLNWMQRPTTLRDY